MLHLGSVHLMGKMRNREESLNGKEESLNGKEESLNNKNVQLYFFAVLHLLRTVLVHLQAFGVI